MTPFGPLRVALLAATALLAVAAAPALATDAFYFRSATGVTFTPKQGRIDGRCVFGPTGVFITGPTGAPEGSIRTNASPSCGNIGWGSDLAYQQTYRGSYQNADRSTTYLWVGGIGAIAFWIFDPMIGSASLSCGGNGAQWEQANGYTPIESYMTAEVDDDTCTVSWLPGARSRATGGGSAAAGASGTHTRVTDGLATVEGRRAHVRLQAFGRLGSHVVDHVTVRDGDGALLGRATERLRVGDAPRDVVVRLTREAAARIERDGELVARVVVRHREGHVGTGDTSRRVVLRPAPSR